MSAFNVSVHTLTRDYNYAAIAASASDAIIDALDRFGIAAVSALLIAGGNHA